MTVEFVIGMMQILGVELCGEPLKWDDVRPFVHKFTELDVSRTGTINQEDLLKFYESESRAHQAKLESLAWSAGAKRRVAAQSASDAKKKRPNVVVGHSATVSIRQAQATADAAKRLREITAKRLGANGAGGSQQLPPPNRMPAPAGGAGAAALLAAAHTAKQKSAESPTQQII